MTCLTFGRSHGHTVVAKDISNSESLTSVSGMCRSSVRIDITNVTRIDTTILQAELQ